MHYSFYSNEPELLDEFTSRLSNLLKCPRISIKESPQKQITKRLNKALDKYEKCIIHVDDVEFRLPDTIQVMVVFNTEESIKESLFSFERFVLVDTEDGYVKGLTQTVQMLSRIDEIYKNEIRQHLIAQPFTILH